MGVIGTGPVGFLGTSGAGVAFEDDPIETGPVGLFSGTNEAGKGKGTTGTDPVGGFDAMEAPVGGGAEGVPGTDPVGGFDAKEVAPPRAGITAVLLGGGG